MRPRRIAIVLATLALVGCNDPEDGQERETGPHACGGEPGDAPAQRFRVEPGEAVDETARALCERLRAAGVEEATVEEESVGELTVSGKEDADSRAALELGTRRGAIVFYDWEPNVLGTTDPDRPFGGAKGLYNAVRYAARARPKAETTDVLPGRRTSPRVADRRNDAVGARYYRFDDAGNLTGGPSATCTPLGCGEPGVLKVPRGVVVVQAERLPDQPERLIGHYVIEDDAELSGAHVRNPEQSFDQQTSEPIVTFEFTDSGRARFAQATERVALRGASLARERALPLEAALQSFAIVVDGRVLSRPTIDFVALPHGIDGRSGAQINGVGDIAETQVLAANLQRPLPADLVPVD